MSQSALQAGSLSYNGPRRIYIPKPIILATNSGAGEVGPTALRVLVPVPDSRTRVKVTIMFVPTAGVVAPALAAGFSVWVAAAEQDQTGGGGGRIVPVTNIEGTEAAPTPFPVNGLGGYSREFVTAADYLQVVATVSSISPASGAWMLQTRIQPDSVSFDWDEWDEIRRAFQPFNTGQMASL